MNYFTIWNFY